jgi:hypothetical protein
VGISPAAANTTSGSGLHHYWPSEYRYPLCSA